MRDDLDPQETIEESVAGDRSVFQIGERSMSVRTYLERFLFEPADARRRIGTLSGGERARVALAKILSSDANLLVFDEPTNDLDVATLGALESMILDFGGTALIVSHDRWFLDRLATSILAFEGAGVVRHYQGNYSDSREAAARNDAVAAQLERAERTATAVAANKATAASRGAPRARKLTYAERQELEGLLPAIEQAESKVADLEARLADPAVYANRGDAVKELLGALDEARTLVERLTARWEELEALRP
jgi:ATP-binding cassette subfamily F protein uup